MSSRTDGKDPPLTTRVVLRPVGNPLPLGFLGLFVATLMLASLNLAWIPKGGQHQVAIVLVLFAFPLQAVSTIFGFLSRDAVVASGIGVQGASWLTIGVILLMSRPGTTSPTLALFLFVAAAALASSVAVAVQSKIVPALVMAGTCLRFVMTGIYEKTGQASWEHASGWEGLVLAAVALYAAVALDLESTHHRTTMPLLRRGSGKTAMEGGAAAQVADVEHEPGVRDQL